MSTENSFSLWIANPNSADADFIADLEVDPGFSDQWECQNNEFKCHHQRISAGDLQIIDESPPMFGARASVKNKRASRNLANLITWLKRDGRSLMQNSPDKTKCLFISYTADPRKPLEVRVITADSRTELLRSRSNTLARSTSAQSRESTVAMAEMEAKLQHEKKKRMVAEQMNAEGAAAESAAVANARKEVELAQKAKYQKALDVAETEKLAAQQLAQKAGQKSFKNRQLLSLSQNHNEWVFGAIAELIANAREANARNLHISHSVLGDVYILSLTDDGTGQILSELDSMMRIIGETAKDDHYGVGFKSGSMRIGHDALVFTRHASTDGCYTGYIGVIGYLSLNEDDLGGWSEVCQTSFGQAFMVCCAGAHDGSQDHS